MHFVGAADDIPYSTKWSSHKFGKKPGLSYEFAPLLSQSKVLWINGPSLAGTGDRTIFKNGLVQALQDLSVKLGREV